MWEHFGDHVEALGDSLGGLGDAFGVLWELLGTRWWLFVHGRNFSDHVWPLCATLAKTLEKPTVFEGFKGGQGALRIHFGALGATFGILWEPLGTVRVLLGTLWVLFGVLWAIWGFLEVRFFVPGTYSRTPGTQN